jgi:hypothetical protein
MCWIMGLWARGLWVCGPNPAPVSGPQGAPIVGLLLSFPACTYNLQGLRVIYAIFEAVDVEGLQVSRSGSFVDQTSWWIGALFKIKIYLYFVFEVFMLARLSGKLQLGALTSL